MGNGKRVDQGNCKFWIKCKLEYIITTVHGRNGKDVG